MDYSKHVSAAVEHFWRTRLKQHKNQGITTGIKDAGNRSAVTGGAQLDGFVELLATILTNAGIKDHSIHTKKTSLPGYYRPTKNWDLVAVVEGNLIATIEFKSHVGPSFGNNFNNRVEEALGSATDIWAAYREGAFKPSIKPWLGWMMLLEDDKKSMGPVSVREPHYRTFSDFDGASYAKRYEIFCQRLLRERMYDGTCLLLSDREKGIDGKFTEPNIELSFKRFAASLEAHTIAYINMK